MKLFLFWCLAVSRAQDASDPCTLMTAGCSNFRFEIQMNEECRQAEYASINATRLAANGQSDEECRFSQLDDGNWAMNISMAECSIVAQHVNTTDISYHLELSSISSNSSNGLIYRHERGFAIGFDCYMHREASFSSDGWTIVSGNTNVTHEYDLNGQRDETLSETIFDFAIDDADNYSQSNCSQDEPCLEISIGEEVMFNIEVDESMADAFLYRLDYCIATPMANRDVQSGFTLLEQGCTTEDWINADEHNISFPFFAFYSTNEVYIHCDIRLCAPGYPEECQMPTAETCAADANATDARKRRSSESATSVMTNAIKASIDAKKSYGVYEISNADGTTVKLLGNESRMGGKNLVGQVTGVEYSNAMLHCVSLISLLLAVL